MRCYICNRETDNFKKDPDGRYVSICNTCNQVITENLKAISKEVREDDDNNYNPLSSS